MSEKESGEKDVPSDTSSDPKTAKSADVPKRVKERQKLFKKKKSRSATKPRLSGGADEAGGSAVASSEQVVVKMEPKDEAEEGEEASSFNQPGNGAASSLSRPSSGSHCSKPSLPSTGDPRVDEMLERALHNLEEASKALASLGENVEHELKVEPTADTDSRCSSRHPTATATATVLSKSAAIRAHRASRRSKRHD